MKSHYCEHLSLYAGLQPVHSVPSHPNFMEYSVAKAGAGAPLAQLDHREFIITSATRSITLTIGTVANTSAPCAPHGPRKKAQPIRWFSRQPQRLQHRCHSKPSKTVHQAATALPARLSPRTPNPGDDTRALVAPLAEVIRRAPCSKASGSHGNKSKNEKWGVKPVSGQCPLSMRSILL